ncbi:MAG: DUF4114 domain-containing protein [Crinalium sp.]
MTSIVDKLNEINQIDTTYSVSLVEQLKLTSFQGDKYYTINFGPTFLILKQGTVILNGTTDPESFKGMIQNLQEIYGVRNIQYSQEYVDDQNLLFFVDIDIKEANRNGFKLALTKTNNENYQLVTTKGSAKTKVIIDIYDPSNTFNNAVYQNVYNKFLYWAAGYVQNGTVFFDTNLNGIPDPGEPTTTTNRNGQSDLFFTVDEFAQIDVNKNDKIDLTEGRLAMIRGVNSAAEVSYEGILTAVADPSPTTVTPVTSLVERMARLLLADPTIPDPVQKAKDLIQERWHHHIIPNFNQELVAYSYDPTAEQRLLEYPDPTTIRIFDDNVGYFLNRNGIYDIRPTTLEQASGTIFINERLDKNSVDLKPLLSPEAYDYLIGAQIETITELFAAATEQPINKVLDLLADSLLNPNLAEEKNLGGLNTVNSFVGSWLNEIDPIVVDGIFDIDKLNQHGLISLTIEEASRNLALEAYQAVKDGQEPDSFRDVYRVNAKVQRLMKDAKDILNKIYQGEFNDITAQQYNDFFSSKGLQERFDNSTYTADNIFPVDTKSFTLSIPEDGEYVLQVSDFPFIKGDTNDTLKSVIVRPLEAFIGTSKGSLKLKGQEITAETDIAVEDIQAGSLTYTPAKGSLSTNSFDFSVTDGKFYSDKFQRAILDIEMKPLSLTQTSTDLTNRFLQFNGNAGVAQLEVTLTDKQLQPFSVNEIGVFIVEDEQGRVAGLLPTEAGYIEAALKTSQVIFSVLPDDFVTNPTRTLSKLGNQRLGFYLVQNGTTDEVLNNPNAANKVLLASPTSSQTPGFASLENVEQNLFQLEFKTQGDKASVLKLSLKPTEVEEPLGATRQGQRQQEVVDLRNLFLESVEAVFPVVKSEAAFANTVGFYQVENSQGGVIDPLTGALISPGDAAYMQAALRNSQEHGTSFGKEGAGTSDIWEGGHLYAPFIIANGTMEQALSNQDNAPLAYFAYIGANSDKVDHIRLLGNNTWGFEDLHGGGDADFNDIVIQAKFTPIGS